MAEESGVPTTGTTVARTRDYKAVKSLLTSIRLEIETTGSGDQYEELVLGIIDDVAAATTEDEVFAAQDMPALIPGKEFVNRPFRLRNADIRWIASTLQNDWFFSIIKVTAMDDGQQYTVDCGGRTFVTVLRKLQLLGSFDAWEEHGGKPLMLTSKPTTAGYEVLFLRPVKLEAPAKKRERATKA